MCVQNDSRSSRILKKLWGALIVVTCLRVWLGPIQPLDRAQAQILPNPADQRIATLQEARRTNQLLEKLISTLETRTFKVRIEANDKPGGKPVPVRGVKTGRDLGR
jgi:hypothetical protein